MKGLAIAAAIAFLTPMPSFAGEGCGGESHDANFVVNHIFEAADGNADGALTAEEYAAAGLERYGVSFEQTDADGDGATTLEEYRALYDRHHPAPAEDGDAV